MLLMGFRVGLNLQQDGVLDVGYAGVIGAQRIADGTAPYGRFPERETGRPCGPPNADGEIADWIQANGRCETALPLGDTYGPVNYHAYLPGLAVLGWSGKWDRLPAVRFTTLLFDVLALLGLAAVGFRFGGTEAGGGLGVHLGVRVCSRNTFRSPQRERRDHARVSDLGFLGGVV